ncbi:hypothetical protein [Ferrimonas kyonanensis]|uniref:hypothetical protein n=1 Tax=Ferrimonas kyonanensis TaxID=364763 RepID=UPI0004812714|nr:hypothetical protein [Ferrimonas kyonanensis]
MFAFETQAKVLAGEAHQSGLQSLDAQATATCIVRAATVQIVLQGSDLLSNPLCQLCLEMFIDGELSFTV